MGYYTGNGVVTGGGNNISLFGTLSCNGAHHVYQRSISTTTTKAGVSLATAQGEGSSISLSYHVFGWANIYPWYGAKGSKKNVNYNRIGDSNLYVLNINNEALAVSDDGSTWNS